MIYSQLPEWNITHKKIFLRADLNVPLNQSIISNDFRLTSILPTLNYLLEKNNMVILATHIGDPKTNDQSLSTKLLIPWFKQKGYSITFAPDILCAATHPVKPNHIVLLENLRFFPGEKNGDPFFAKELANTADYYVNDAFGTIHRNDCSITLLPYEFTENKRTIGFLIEKELCTLDTLTHNPQKPFVTLLGGKKIEDKIPLIQGLLKTVDTILLCPALCFSFLKACGKTVGKSLINNELLSLCTDIMHKAEDNNKKIVLPLDYLVADKTVDGKLSYVDANNFPLDGIGITIGPKTVQLFKKEIDTSHTFFVNCAMGFNEKPETLISSTQLFSDISYTNKVSIAAGGDTIERLSDAHVLSQFTHVSTGGGAALSYLSGKQLPGLNPFTEEH
jgi:phosphoglycerate kinase